MKRVFIFLLVALVTASLFASCANGSDISQPGESSQSAQSAEQSEQSNSPAVEYALEYNGFGITESMLDLVLAGRKGYTELMYASSGVDFVSHPEYWDLEYADGISYGSYIKGEVIKTCRSLCVTLYLADKYGVTLADESEIDSYIEDVAERFESREEFQAALTEIGSSEDDLRYFLKIGKLASLLKEKLLSADGELAYAQSELDGYTSAQLAELYCRFDVLYYSFYLSDDKTKYVDESLTDDDGYEYFLSGYGKMSYILFASDDAEAAQGCLTKLQTGKSDLETQLVHSIDTNSAALFAFDTADKALKDALVGTEVGGYALAATDDGVFVLRKEALSRADFSDSIRSSCLWELSKTKIRVAAEELFNKLESGDAELSDKVETDFFSYYGGSTLITAQMLSEEFFNEVKTTPKDGYVMREINESGIFIMRRQELTEDDKEQYTKELADEFKDNRYAEFADSFSAGVTENTAITDTKSILNSGSILY